MFTKLVNAINVIAMKKDAVVMCDVLLPLVVVQRFHVSLESIVIDKVRVAMFTLVRLLTIMPSDMHLQRRLGHKRSGTLVAGVFANVHVPFEMRS